MRRSVYREGCLSASIPGDAGDLPGVLQGGGAQQQGVAALLVDDYLQPNIVQSELRTYLLL